MRRNSERPSSSRSSIGNRPPSSRASGNRASMSIASVSSSRTSVTSSGKASKIDIRNSRTSAVQEENEEEYESPFRKPSTPNLGIRRASISSPGASPTNGSTQNDYFGARRQSFTAHSKVSPPAADPLIHPPPLPGKSSSSSIKKLSFKPTFAKNLPSMNSLNRRTNLASGKASSKGSLLKSKSKKFDSHTPLDTPTETREGPIMTAESFASIARSETRESTTRLSRRRSSTKFKIKDSEPEIVYPFGPVKVTFLKDVIEVNENPLTRKECSWIALPTLPDNQRAVSAHRQYSVGIPTDQEEVGRSIQKQHSIMEERMHMLQDSLYSTKAEIKSNKAFTKYILHETIDIENDLNEFMGRAISELVTDLCTIIQGQINKYNADEITGDRAGINIFAITEKIQNENRLASVFEIAQSHGKASYDIAMVVTEKMKSSAVVLSDFSPRSGQNHPQTRSSGRWGRASARLAQSNSQDNEIMSVLKWQLEQEKKEHQKAVEREKFAKKKLTFGQFFDLFSNVTDANVEFKRGSVKSKNSSRNSSAHSISRETYLSASSSNMLGSGPLDASGKGIRPKRGSATGGSRKASAMGGSRKPSAMGGSRKQSLQAPRGSIVAGARNGFSSERPSILAIRDDDFEEMYEDEYED